MKRTGIIGNNRPFVRPSVRPSVILSKYIQSKNAFKTVLARSGAEKNSFLCFDHFLCMTDVIGKV